MQKKSALAILFILLLSSSAFSQIDVLLPVTAIEKKEIVRILGEYGQFMHLMSDSGKVAEKKAASVKFLKENLDNANIFVINDLDSNSKNEDYLNFFKYTQKLPEALPKNVKTSIITRTAWMDKVKYDKIRRYYFVEARAEKVFQWYELSERQVPDTLAITDSLATDSLPMKVVYDTIPRFWKQKLSFYVKFDRANNISRNFKLYAISKAGKEPKLEPLPELITWWLGLDPEWKAVFRKRFPKMEEYPREFDVMKVTSLSEVDLSGSKISDLEPLRKFTYLQKLNIANTPVKNLEPILGVKALKELDFSMTKVDTLKGLNQLTNLEKLYFKGIGIVDISPVQHLTKLLELDCSENEIEDISAVKNLTFLEELDFSLNIRIKDISAVSELVTLNKLAMRKIDIRNLDHLRKLENLVYLDLFNTNITSLEPIRHLKKIMHLDLSHNKITSLEPIKNYQYIALLYLASSSVVDLSELKGFINLREIDISKTLIETLGPLHKLEYLKTLKCHYTKIDKNEVQRFKKNHPGCAITYYY